MKVNRHRPIILGLMLAMGLWCVSLYAYDPADPKPMLAHEIPEDLQGVSLEDKLGKTLNLSLPFVDDNGDEVTLGRYFNGVKPVILSMVYYECPSLCNLHLNGLVEAFKDLKYTPGKDFDLVTVSMNHRENDYLASEKKATYVEELGKPEAQEGFHFLTGTEENIKKLADQLGFQFRWDEEQQEYAHASVAYIMTPGGVISRYLSGISFQPQTLRLALLEASDGKIGSIVDQIVLYCFQFNPAKNKYTIYAWNIMRIGAMLVVVLLAIFLIPLWIRERRRNNTA